MRVGISMKNHCSSVGLTVVRSFSDFLRRKAHNAPLTVADLRRHEADFIERLVPDAFTMQRSACMTMLQAEINHGRRQNGFGRLLMEDVVPLFESRLVGRSQIQQILANLRDFMGFDFYESLAAEAQAILKEVRDHADQEDVWTLFQADPRCRVIKAAALLGLANGLLVNDDRPKLFVSRMQNEQNAKSISSREFRTITREADHEPFSDHTYGVLIRAMMQPFVTGEFTDDVIRDAEKRAFGQASKARQLARSAVVTRKIA